MPMRPSLIVKSTAPSMDRISEEENSDDESMANTVTSIVSGLRGSMYGIYNAMQSLSVTNKEDEDESNSDTESDASDTAECSDDYTKEQ